MPHGRGVATFHDQCFSYSRIAGHCLLSRQTSRIRREKYILHSFMRDSLPNQDIEIANPTLPIRVKAPHDSQAL